MEGEDLIGFLGLEFYQSSDNLLYWLIFNWLETAWFFFSPDYVDIVLCERYMTFFFLTHGRADISVAGCFPSSVLPCSVPALVQFSWSLVSFEGPGSSCAVQVVCGNCSWLYQGQDAWGINPCSQLFWYSSQCRVINVSLWPGSLHLHLESQLMKLNSFV